VCGAVGHGSRRERREGEVYLLVPTSTFCASNIQAVTEVAAAGTLECT
jgi:hypothetical protein